MSSRTEKDLAFQIDTLLGDVEIAADKINFCILNLMELVEPAAYDDYEEKEKPFYFWNNRERLQNFIEMQVDYYHDIFMPKLKQVEELASMLMEEQKKQDKAD